MYLPMDHLRNFLTARQNLNTEQHGRSPPSLLPTTNPAPAAAAAAVAIAGLPVGMASKDGFEVYSPSAGMSVIAERCVFVYVLIFQPATHSA